MQTIEEYCCMQGIMYGGQSTEGHLGDAWLLDSGTMTWQQTATTDFGGFSDAAKAWHAAAVLKCTDVRPPGLLEAHLSNEAVAAILSGCVSTPFAYAMAVLHSAGSPALLYIRENPNV